MVTFQQLYGHKLDAIVIDTSTRTIKTSIPDAFSDHLAKIYDEVIQKLNEDHKVYPEKSKKRSLFEEEDKHQEDQQKKEDTKKAVMPRYYYVPSTHTATYHYHVYTPGGIEIIRVPQIVLGPNILGRAFTGTNRVEILETLSGLPFEEVKKHEVNHILFPYLGEWEIRQKTKAELPFEPYFH